MSAQNQMAPMQIVYCARAKASTLGDPKVVEEQGPAKFAHELQVSCPPLLCTAE